MTKPDTQHDSGSFLTGLGVGLIGGAVGYFLFATDKGEKFRKQFKLQWKDLQKMAKPMIEEHQQKDGSLKELLGEFFNEMLEQAKLEQKQAEEEAAKAKDKKKGKKKLFRGVG